MLPKGYPKGNYGKGKNNELNNFNSNNMVKNIKFITEEKGVKVYEYSFNGDNIFILQESNKEIVFQAKKATLSQFEQSDEYQLVCNYFDKINI